jgi:hypothetical protein
MEKITLKALQLAGFQNADMIAKIINYVPNPRVATEMLLGIHEPQFVHHTHRFREYKHDTVKLYEILSIDELANRVTYKKYEQNTKYVYYLTKEDYNNKVYQEDRPKDYYTTGHIPTTGFSERESSMEMDEFTSNYSTIIPVDMAMEKLKSWEDYGIPQYELSDDTLENELPF